MNGLDAGCDAFQYGVLKVYVQTTQSGDHATSALVTITYTFQCHLTDIMASVTEKIQNLIDFILNSDDFGDDEKKESIVYLESAPKPQPSTSDIDPSSIKIVILGCGLVVPPMIEVKCPLNPNKFHHFPTFTRSPFSTSTFMDIT